MHDGSSVPGASGVTVRLLGPGDAILLRGLRLDALHDAAHALLGDRDAEARRTTTDWNRELTAGTWFVAVSESGAAVGLARLVDYPGERPSAHLETMWVHPGHRRNGVARRLVAFAEEVAADRGHDRLALWVIRSNAAAERLYLSLGYRPTGRRGPLPDGRLETEYGRDLVHDGGRVAG